MTEWLSTGTQTDSATPMELRYPGLISTSSYFGTFNKFCCRKCSGVLVSSSFFFYSVYLAMLGLCCCRLFSSCSERGSSLVAVWGLLIVVAFLVADHGWRTCGLQQLWFPGDRAHAQWLYLRGLAALGHMRPSWIQINCISPALVGRFFTTEVPGKPRSLSLDLSFSSVLFRILEIVLRYIVLLTYCQNSKV